MSDQEYTDQSTPTPTPPPDPEPNVQPDPISGGEPPPPIK